MILACQLVPGCHMHLLIPTMPQRWQRQRQQCNSVITPALGALLLNEAQHRMMMSSLPFSCLLLLCANRKQRSMGHTVLTWKIELKTSWSCCSTSFLTRCSDHSVGKCYICCFLKSKSIPWSSTNRMSHASFWHVHGLIEHNAVFQSTGHWPQHPVKYQLVVYLLKFRAINSLWVGGIMGVTEGTVYLYSKWVCHALHNIHTQHLWQYASQVQQGGNFWKMSWKSLVSQDVLAYPNTFSG